jgi:hypothetical protein
MAAVRFGFAEMFHPLYRDSRIQTSLLEGTSASLNFFSKQVLPAVKALRANDAFALASIVRVSSPLLAREILKSKGPQQLHLARRAADALLTLFTSTTKPTFRATAMRSVPFLVLRESMASSWRFCCQSDGLIEAALAERVPLPEPAGVPQ